MTTATIRRISDDLGVQACYEECLANGCAPQLAEMLALRQPPGCQTDREFTLGQGTLAQQFEGEEHNLRRLVAKAKSMGYTPDYTDVYTPTLVRPEVGPGDPQAFVPQVNGRSHVKRVLERNNWPGYGMVNRKAVEREPEVGPVIDPEIVNREVARKINENPSLAPKRAELTEEFIHTHGAPDRIKAAADAKRRKKKLILKGA